MGCGETLFKMGSTHDQWLPLSLECCPSYQARLGTWDSGLGAWRATLNNSAQEQQYHSANANDIREVQDVTCMLSAAARPKKGTAAADPLHLAPAANQPDRPDPRPAKDKAEF